MILALKLKNFKSIKDSGAIKLRPLTIFAGPNASGKSNILEGLAFLAQMTGLPPDTSHTFHGNLQYGEFMRYPYPVPVDSLVHKKDLNVWISFEVKVGTRTRTLSGVMIRATSYIYDYRPASEEVRQHLYRGKKHIVGFSYKKVEDGGYQSRFIHPPSLKGRGAPRGNEALNIENLKGSPSEEASEISEALRLARTAMGTIIQQLRKVYFVSAERGHVELRVTVSPEIGPRMEREGPTWVGRNGEYLIELLASIFGARAHIKKANKIDKWARKFGIGNIKAGWRGQNFLGSDFNDPILKSPLELTFASYGSRQLLTVITQLFWSKPGDTILIEEPEMSLHPESQILLQELFAEAIREGKQIICTTHSPFFILALSKVIRTKKLSKNDVAIYHVEKKKKGTEIKKLELNEQGFVTKWIPSYIDIENELFHEWAKSFEEKKYQRSR